MSYHAGFAMKRVHLGILGLFNTSESGHNYILMMLNKFSKWIEKAALPDQTAMSVVSNPLCCHFWVPLGSAY